MYFLPLIRSNGVCDYFISIWCWIGISIFDPLEMAETPVRDTSTSPSERMSSINAVILELLPVISKTKDASVLSSVLARNVSAMRSASIRASPVFEILISASSRSI
jgi:hypothetical protein